jgi:hypothetical protein
LILAEEPELREIHLLERNPSTRTAGYQFAWLLGELFELPQPLRRLDLTLVVVRLECFWLIVVSACATTVSREKSCAQMSCATSNLSLAKQMDALIRRQHFQRLPGGNIRQLK